jgi:hypothetical protein
VVVLDSGQRFGFVTPPDAAASELATDLRGTQADR